MRMPFAGVYYFKLEKSFPCSTITFLLFKDLPIFALNLWMMRDMIISSTESVLAYVVTCSPVEDDTLIDEVKVSPEKSGKRKNKLVKVGKPIDLLQKTLSMF